MHAYVDAQRKSEIYCAGEKNEQKKAFFSFSRSEKLRTEILISPSAHLSHTKTGQTKEILHSARNMPADKVDLFHTQGFFAGLERRIKNGL